MATATLEPPTVSLQLDALSVEALRDLLAGLDAEGPRLEAAIADAERQAHAAFEAEDQPALETAWAAKRAHQARLIDVQAQRERAYAAFRAAVAPLEQAWLAACEATIAGWRVEQQRAADHVQQLAGELERAIDHVEDLPRARVQQRRAHEQRYAELALRVGYGLQVSQPEWEVPQLDGRALADRLRALAAHLEHMGGEA